MQVIAGTVTKEGKRIRKAIMNIKTGLTALLMCLPLLANAGAREELMALEATKTPLLTLQPSPPPPFRYLRRPSLMALPDGRRANMKDYAVVLFMQAHCQYSAKFDPLLKGWLMSILSGFIHTPWTAAVMCLTRRR
jgi:hypothetical protein